MLIIVIHSTLDAKLNVECESNIQIEISGKRQTARCTVYTKFTVVYFSTPIQPVSTSEVSKAVVVFIFVHIVPFQLLN